MKRKLIIPILFFAAIGFAQESQSDPTTSYKKRVLDATEVDFLNSYYVQDGNNASVTGGIGNEHLTNFAPTIVISMPLNADDQLTIDAGISTYTSASSSNLNPFDLSGASRNGYEDDDKEVDYKGSVAGEVIGSPWVASSGASSQDTWAGVSAHYSHSSDDRNTIWNANTSFATEYDYRSFGFGGGLIKLFNEKNTTFSASANVYLDAWNPVYPTELHSYLDVGGDLNNGFFEGITILDQDGNPSTDWHPVDNFSLIENKARNSYSVSLSFSQILSKKAQFSVFFDLVMQQGWLANPMQRVYFKDIPNYYIGNAESIPIYTSPKNKDVFQLADDIERLPDTRLKIPIGIKLNYFINERFALRTYYRYYYDDWGIKSNTVSIEIPIKISSKFTIFPSYRFYNQTAADYFAPYEEHLSTDNFYTSDYDLSKFNSNQYGFGLNYTDIFTKFHIATFGLKSIDFKYNNYVRNTGLKAHYVGLGFKFIMD